MDILESLSLIKKNSLWEVFVLILQRPLVAYIVYFFISKGKIRLDDLHCTIHKMKYAFVKVLHVSLSVVLAALQLFGQFIHSLG